MVFTSASYPSELIISLFIFELTTQLIVFLFDPQETS